MAQRSTPRQVHPLIADALEQTERLYDRQLRACEELLDFVLELLQPWRGRALEHPHDGIMGAIFARSTNTYWAALELARIGFGEQASMLNRSLFEDMVDLHWISENPELAVERYDKHLTHGQMLLADALRNHPDFIPAEEVPAFDPDERKRLDRVFGAHGTKSWTTANLHDRVASVEHIWGDEGDRRHLRFFRDIVHRDNNQLLHVSAHGLNQIVRRAGEDEGGIAYKLGPGGEYLEQALFGMFWIYSQSVGLVLEKFDFREQDDFDRLFSKQLPAFRDLSDDELKSVGRNAPCPCGSGKKLKHCHGG
jgi:hypothetical protein